MKVSKFISIKPFYIATILLSAIGFNLITPVKASANWNARWEPAIGRQGWYPSGAFTSPELGGTYGVLPYICRTRGGIGKLALNREDSKRLLITYKCYVGLAGKEIGYDQYHVLMGGPNDYDWVRHTGKMPSSSVYAGIDPGKESIYVCAANHRGNWIPGKFVPSHNTCYIPYDGEEHEYKHFYILIKK